MSALSVILCLIPSVLIILMIRAPERQAKRAIPFILGAAILCTIAAMPVDPKRAVADVVLQEMAGKAHASPMRATPRAEAALL